MNFPRMSGFSGHVRHKDSRRGIVARDGYGPNWHRQKARVLKRDKSICVKCNGRNSKKVQVHHKRKISWFVEYDEKLEKRVVNYIEANAMNNLETVCSVCHPHLDSGHSNKSGFTNLTL